jgi:hypothetical protein
MLCQTEILQFWSAVSDFRNIEKPRNLCKIQLTPIFSGRLGRRVSGLHGDGGFEGFHVIEWGGAIC